MCLTLVVPDLSVDVCAFASDVWEVEDDTVPSSGLAHFFLRELRCVDGVHDSLLVVFCDQPFVLLGLRVFL